jgi:CRP/FNR family transcriptional regulator
MASEDTDGEYTVNITQDELARLVGSSREQVNRVLRDLSSMGYITISRGRIHICNKIAMEQMMR